MQKVQSNTNIKGKNLWSPIRIALTGTAHGADLGSIVEILGYKKCCQRIYQSIND